MTDIQIAQAAELLPIGKIAEKAGLAQNEWEMYGRHKAKVSKKADRPAGKLVLVTAMSPTPSGEGKTTVSVGLADGLQRIGQKVMLCLREPSLGPVFGVKGGAAGGGYAQVVPMEDINLHFTGDIHAVTSANNLLAAAIDNHLQQGNALAFDVRRITWKRCMDMNDRSLRSVMLGMGGTANGIPRQDGFDITAASEVMAVLCLADGPEDFKLRLGRMIVGYTRRGDPITCSDLKVHGAMAALLRDALMPNLVQTLEHTPTLIHGGPFANIAHGCNSVSATKLALSLANVVVTEAGFGADLGAEKFVDIKCRSSGLTPSACVIVATVRACAHHGGMDNLRGHIENVTRCYGLSAVVAINRFSDDTEEKLDEIRRLCESMGVRCAVCDVWAEGGRGGEELAREVVSVIEESENGFRYVYPLELSLTEKILTVAKDVYGAGDVEFSLAAEKSLKKLTKLGFGNLPVCIAKTQYSFSDDPQKLGRPEGFKLYVSDAKVSAGAGFVVVFTGELMTMPGLPKISAYEQVDIDSDGIITGLF